MRGKVCVQRGMKLLRKAGRSKGGERAERPRGERKILGHAKKKKVRFRGKKKKKSVQETKERGVQ